MPLCCPPGRGCNSAARREPCALLLCRRVAGEEPLAALALGRWEEWRSACERQGTGRRENRFRRRAYERARDAAIVAVLMRRAPMPRPRARPTRRLGALRGRHRSGQRR